MASSLFDQLKKAGVVDEKKARQVSAEKRRKTKRTRTGQEAPDTEIARAAERAAAEKAARDRALNRERQAEQARREMAAQVAQIVERHRVPRDAAGDEYSFVDGDVVRRILLADGQRALVAGGALAIVRAADVYEVVPAAVAERIAERAPDAVVVHHERDAGLPDADDPYAGYEVPDDLMW